MAPTWAEAVGRRWRLALGLPGAARGGLARSCEKGSAWRDAAERAKTVGPACRLGARVVQYARSGRVPCMH